MNYETRSFQHRGHRLVYDEYGEGDRLVVYLHGLLLDAELNRGIAAGLARQGFRVVLLDLLGHGRSDKPPFASDHRMDAYATQVVALLDHLEVPDAVIAGVSLGANVCLFVAADHPERVRGLIAEMPVLEWAVPAAALAFVPLLLVTHYGRHVVALTSSLTRRLPRTPWGPFNSLMNAVSSGPMNLAAVLHGVLVGPICPTREARAAIAAPTLVLGHGFDPIHAFDDADNLAALLPDARLVRTRSFRELRMSPDRLLGVIGEFAAERWTGAAPSGRRIPPRKGAPIAERTAAS
jgi:pimeloyl-ACP methyl ester carboxylesterase